MKIKDLELGIASYCENRVAPMLASSLDRWLLFAGLALGSAKIETAIQKLVPAAREMGIIDVDGNVDLDLLEKVGLAAFEKQPKIQVWKITFIREDFSDFMRYLRGNP